MDSQNKHSENNRLINAIKASQTLALFAGLILFAVPALALLQKADSATHSAQYLTEMQFKINPNSANAPSLERLAGIGPARAKAIIDYRQKYTNKTGQNRVYKKPSDLMKVHGIGPKTVEKIKPFLVFDNCEIERAK